MSRATAVARVLAVVLLGLAAAPAARAADAALTVAQLEKAQAAHDRGIGLRRTDPAAAMQAFRDAAREWEAARAAGAENGPLEFNLGNACMEAGDLGRAIAAYLRAERFMPGDADLEHNLARARATVKSTFERSGGTVLVDSAADWWHLLPRSVRLGGGWACWIGFWLALAAGWLLPRARTHGAWRAAVGVMLAGWVILGGTVVADEALHAMRPRAVLVDANVTLRKGNGDGFEPAFEETLGPGVECTVIERRPGWLRVRLPDGRSGWLREAQATDV